MLIGTVSTVNAEANQNSIITDNGNVYFAGSMNNWKKVELEPDSANNKYTGSIVINGSDNYQFKIVVGSNWYSFNGVTFSKDNTVCENLYKDNDNFNLTPISKSDKINLNVVFYKNYNNSCSRLEVTQTLATDPVADSVTLEANPTSISGGESSTLTATLKGKNSSVGNVTYTFTDASNKTVGRKTTSDSTASIKVKPTATTTYKVTVSADNYTSVTNTVTVTATSDSSAETTQPVTGDYYFWYSTNPDIEHYSGNWHKVHMTKNGSSYYVSNLPVNVGGNFYFIVNENAEKPYRNTVWKTRNDVTVDYKECAGNLSDKGIEDRYVPMESNPNQKEQVFFYRISVIKNGSYSFTFDGDKTVKVTEGGSIQPTEPTETVKITVPTVDNATVTAVANSKIHNEGESFNIKEGSSFTVNVKGENGYTLKKITYGTQSGTETGAEFTAEPGVKTFSVDMVQTVSNPVTVTFGSDNNGTVSAIHNGAAFTSGETVNVGDEVTITATPSGSDYIFKSWSIIGDYVIKDSKTTSDAEITLVVKSNITATASFTQAAPFKVAYGSNTDVKTIDMVATKKDGIYVSTAPLANDTNFTIYDVSNNKYALKNNNDTWYINVLDASIDFEDWSNNPTIDGNAGGFRNNTSRPAYVFYNSNYSTVTLQTEPDFGDKAVLYVKTGTSGEGATGEYASNSEAPKLRATSSGTTYKKYSVEYDTNVNIQTTMSDKYLKARYYVAGYSVNGRSYPASAVDASKGIYQTNITITEDLAENGVVVEVTPIYYNRTIEEEDNYITFYVDAERLVGGWGSTVAIYAYAYKGGTAIYGSDGKPTNNVNLLGAYPGQPMVKDGQYYVAKIPRYSYEMSSDGSLVIDEESPVAGITLNNYYNDAVHNSLVPIKRNMQTYDFSDFVALANKKDVKTIMFQSKFYNATGNAKRNTKVIYNYNTEISDPTKAVQSISNIANANVNPYEDFTDYYGRATDLIGNILDDTQKADKNNLFVISTGSYDSSKSTSGYSTKGQWVTIWNVYDHNGNLITYGTPANFLDETTEQYKKIANNYSGKPVKISYEKGLSYDNGVTSRTDGRWYYSALGQEFTSDVAIEYKGVDDKYIADTNTNTANTGFIGETSGATATINGVTTASFTSVTDNAHLSINVANGWRFDGWYINGDKIGDNYTDISTDVLMSNSYHIVARVSKIPTGTLELNHTAYTGTDPTAHEGTGFYYISAVVKRADNSQIKFDETQGKISIDKFAATDSLEITLKAKCHGDNTVFALYKGEAGGYTEIGTGLNGESEFTYTFTVPADSLFENGKLAVNALNYYTDIVKIGGTCDITYMYKDRFGVEGEGKMVSYVVRNVELSTEEILKDYLPSDETITKYAPRIDTMYVETKWNLTDIGKVKKGRSQATVIATQTKKMCKVYYPTLEGGYYTDIANSTPYEVDYNTLLMDENGNFLLSAPETDGNGSQFSYWDVYKADKNGGNTGELVTKCYERNFGLRIMADYYIEPVYDGIAPTLTANINAPVLNREIYGDSANPKDKLYVDLLTAFTSSDIPTFKENKTNLKVECGVFVVRNNTKTLSEIDRSILVKEALDKNSVDTTSAILESYKRTPNTEELVVNKLEALAVDSNVKDKSNTFDTFDNEQYRITKFIFDNDTLTNKNRIDEVLKYTNNTANQNYIFTAYAFVVIKNSDGTVKGKKISVPQYFNLCYVGNKAL